MDRSRFARRAGAALAFALVAMWPPLPATALGQAPGTPTLLSPPPGWVFPAVAPQVFSIIASDPEGEPYTGLVTVRDAATNQVVRTFTTHPTPSSMKSTGTPLPPLGPGSYRWSAHVADPTGGTSGESASSSFAVEATPSAGGGELDAVLTYGGAGVNHGSCAPTSFGIDGNSAAAVVNVAIVGFAGTLSITGTGSSACENTEFGEGAVTLTLDGHGPTGSALHCPDLDGSYTRAAAALVLQLEGTCIVNEFTADDVTFTAAAGYLPTEPGGGVRSPFNEAAVVGAFTVMPT